MQSRALWFRCAGMLLLTAVLGACTAASPSVQSTETNNTAMTQNTRSHCVGRYLIDLPADYELSTGRVGDATFYFGRDENVKEVEVTIKKGTYTPESFEKAVRQRNTELGSTLNSKLKTPMLLQAERLGDQAFLIRRHDSPHYDSTIKSELHQLIGQRYVVVQHESYPPSYDKKPVFATIDPEPAEQRLKAISKALKPYSESLRATPTFCMQDVVFDFPYDASSAQFYFFGTKHPDVQFELGYNEVFASRPDETLFERIDKFNAKTAEAAAQAGNRTLRRATPTVSGRPAQEFLRKLERPLQQHIFGVEVRAQDWQDVNQPYLLLQMNTGNPYRGPDKQRHTEDASLSDQQALALWDAVRDSLRLRKAPYAGTSYCGFEQPCPRRGLWQLALKPNVPGHIASRYDAVQRLKRWEVDAGQVLPTPTGIPAQDLMWWEWELAISSN